MVRFREHDTFAPAVLIWPIIGHFVRINHEEVSVSHPDAIRAILLKPLTKVSTVVRNQHLDPCF